MISRAGTPARHEGKAREAELTDGGARSCDPKTDHVPRFDDKKKAKKEEAGGAIFRAE